MTYKRVYLDSCIIIYFIEGISQLQQQVSRRLTQLINDGSELWVNDLSRLECLVKPLKENDHQLEQDYKRFFLLPELQIAQLESPIIELATKIRVQHSLKTPDAIHVATALYKNCECILTNDLKFKRLEPDITVELLTLSP